MVDFQKLINYYGKSPPFHDGNLVKAAQNIDGLRLTFYFYAPPVEGTMK
jgi:hypothetical protein